MVTNQSISNSETKGLIVGCPSGKMVIAGGGETTDLGAVLQASRPLDPPFMGWFAAAIEAIPTANNWTLEAFAICANVAE